MLYRSGRHARCFCTAIQLCPLGQQPGQGQQAGVGVSLHQVGGSDKGLKKEGRARGTLFAQGLLKRFQLSRSKDMWQTKVRGQPQVAAGVASCTA